MLRCVCVILWEGCCRLYRKGKGCACATLCVFLYRKGCSGACATQKVPLWKRVLLIHSSGVRLSGAAYNVYNEYYKYLYVCMCCIHVYMYTWWVIFLAWDSLVVVGCLICRLQYQECHVWIFVLQANLRLVKSNTTT